GPSGSRKYLSCVETKPRRPVSSDSCSRKIASTPSRAAARRTCALDSASNCRTPKTGPTTATATKAASRSRIGGDTQIRTGDGAFAELCLTTWLCRPEIDCGKFLERVAGIEPARQPWEG